jgi:hypothetical protein
MPDIIALDDSSYNSTIKVTCLFETKVKPLDFYWKYYFKKDERMAYNADGLTMAPFKHELIDVNDTESESVVSASVLTIPLLDLNYYTNYTIVSIQGFCSRTIRVNLIEKGENSFFFFF